MTTATTSTSLAGYDDLGTGDPALLLIPGWCGDRSVFDPMAARLATARRVVVSDLRGHGGNAHQTGDFDAAEQVDDLAGLVDRLGIDRFVPVGLSHAGWLGIELRRRLGADRVPGLVLLDWMALGPPPGFLEALAGLQDPAAWEDVRGALVGRWTDGVGSRAVHDYVASMTGYGFEHWRRAGREIAASFARAGSPLQALAALDEPCPTLHLYAQPTDDDYLEAQQGAAQEHPWFSVHRLDACSHFPMLEVPGAAARQVAEFADRLA